MSLEIQSLNPSLWPAFEDLFGDGRPCSRCWCMYGRIGNAYRTRKPEENKADFRNIVERGPPPGLLALVDGTAVGWCRLGPRNDLPWLDRLWRLKRIDALPVWSLSCLYVRKSHRRQGITALLVHEALNVARLAGVPALESYPLDAAVSRSASGCGYASTFARAGFRTVSRRDPARPVMRHDLNRGQGLKPDNHAAFPSQG